MKSVWHAMVASQASSWIGGPARKMTCVNFFVEVASGKGIFQIRIIRRISNFSCYPRQRTNFYCIPPIFESTGKKGRMLIEGFLNVWIFVFEYVFSIEACSRCWHFAMKSIWSNSIGRPVLPPECLSHFNVCEGLLIGGFLFSPYHQEWYFTMIW